MSNSYNLNYTVLVYPACSKPSYYTFYLSGFYRLVGRKTVQYSQEGFLPGYRHGLSFRVTEPNGEELRGYIAAGDGPGISGDIAEWSHVYGKINYDREFVSAEHSSKVMPIGPSFGVRLWGVGRAAYEGIRTLLIGFPHIKAIKSHAAHYRAQYLRLPEEAYRASRSKDDYIFFASSLWQKEPDTNRYRAHFMEAASNMTKVNFEGGFAPREDMNDYSHLQMVGRYTLDEYIENTRQSAVSFNTPAVRDCLGWKLGEYLGLGKAIISTPLTREMPEPLVHGEHIHIVDGSKESIQAAIETIVIDKHYRRHLEQNAAAYYQAYLRPDRVIERLLERARENRS
jgi:glycosyltransferase involved in cell wall biosynthesis